jgi:hypothetical protein
MANEFYILLDGEIGIFTLRLDESMTRELAVVNQIRNAVKQGNLQAENISVQLAKVKLGTLTAEEQKFVNNIRQLDDTKVLYTATYLQEKLGDLSYDMLYNELFYNSVPKVKPARYFEIRENQRSP